MVKPSSKETPSKMIKDYSVLGLKNLKRRGVRSWLTLLGIIIGIAVVITLISLGDGLKTAVNAQFGASSTNVLTIQAGGLTGYGPPGTGIVDPLTSEDAEAIAKLGNVEYVIKRNIESIRMEFNNKLIFTSSISTPDEPDRKASNEINDFTIISGRHLKDGDTNKVVLGNDFSLSSKSGFDKKVETGDIVKINDKKFEVVGILHKKGSFIWDRVVIMNELPLNDLVNGTNAVDIIAAHVKNKDLMNKTKGDIEKLLRQRRDVDKGEENFEVSTPEASLATVNSILGGIQLFIAAIAFMSILVGSLGIINTMTTSVIERRREIGIMKAVGARNSDIFLLFLIESGLLGLIGGLIGVIIGVNAGFFGTLAINNFIGAETAPKINILLIILTLIFGFLIGSISGIIPAINAAKQRPVEVLR